MSGARAVRKAIIDDPRVRSLRPIVAWIPILDSDDRTAADAIAAMFADVPVPQMWDGRRLLGSEISRSFGIEDQGVAWDIYLFYPPGAEWTDDGIPRAEKLIAQTMGVVIGLKGTLPPKGDQSRTPDWATGAVDVVGEPSELPALLSEVAVPYVERYKAAAPK